MVRRNPLWVKGIWQPSWSLSNKIEITLRALEERYSGLLRQKSLGRTPNTMQTAVTAHLLANTIPMVKDGSGSMLWGCFTVAGKGRLVRTEGRMNAAKYEYVPEVNLLQRVCDRRLGRQIPFQPDSDPMNTAKTMLERLRDESPTVESPSQSPDLNRIEHSWRELGGSGSSHPVWPSLRGSPGRNRKHCPNPEIYQED